MTSRRYVQSEWTPNGCRTRPPNVRALSLVDWLREGLRFETSAPPSGFHTERAAQLVGKASTPKAKVLKTATRAKARTAKRRVPAS